MQHDDFATKFCEIATTFSYLVAKLQLDFFANFKPCVRGFYDKANRQYHVFESHIIS